MSGRRILVTGVSSFWGGRLAQILEADPGTEAIVGVSPEDPTCELERTEFVRVGTQHSLLRRIVCAAEIDTVVDTRLVVESTAAPARVVHERNAIGTMNILAACGGPDSPVRKVVFKSSAHYYGCERDDPSFFTEEMRRPHPPRTRLEADIVEADDAVQDFAKRNPHVTVTTLRFANGLGPDLRTAHTRLLSLPAVPGILGFDPRYQFVHEDDIIGAIRHAVLNDMPGIFNAAADGVLALSEVASLLGKPFAPVLPPWGTSLGAAPLRALGIRIPDEAMRQLRYGRGLDNRRLKAAGYRYAYTSRETVLRFAEAMRTASLRASQEAPYRYEREVEQFLRYSPSVRRNSESAATGSDAGVRRSTGSTAPRSDAGVRRSSEGAGASQH